MFVGYARVSTEDQNLDMQRQALADAGCEEIFEDHGVSSIARRRPQLDAALERIQPSDVFIVWRLDRLGRSLAYVVQMVESLGQVEIGLRSLTEAIDTTTPSGRLILHLMGALAEFERSLIVERTRAGLAAARRRGVRVGRPPKLNDHHLALARNLLERAPRPALALLGCSRLTRKRCGGRSFRTNAEGVGALGTPRATSRPATPDRPNFGERWVPSYPPGFGRSPATRSAQPPPR